MKNHCDGLFSIFLLILIEEKIPLKQGLKLEKLKINLIKYKRIDYNTRN